MGDSGLATPIAAALALLLASSSTTRRLARIFTAAVLCAACIVFATKLGLFGWGDGIDALSFRGPSGHATLSACVWPVVAWLVSSRAHLAVRVAAVAFGFCIALGVAYVLVAYGYHTLSETVAGTLLGGCASAIFLVAAKAACQPPAGVVVLAILAAIGWLCIQHGRPLVALENFKYAIHALVEKARSPT